MFIDLSRVKVFIKPGSTDFRKKINGLIVIIAEEMKMDPLSSHLFLFCNRSRNRLKIIWWDRTGFCLWMKRLEMDIFPWPKNDSDTIEIDVERLRMLLTGIDFWKAHKELKYSKIC
jgi:transposase